MNKLLYNNRNLIFHLLGPLKNIDYIQEYFTHQVLLYHSSMKGSIPNSLLVAELSLAYFEQ